MDRKNRISTLIAALSLTLLTAGTAAAKPVCINDGGVDYMFSKLKLPKSPGQTTAIVGARYAAAGASAVSGSATMIANGSIRISLFIHAPGPMGEEFTLSWLAADATLAGLAYFDYDGDFQKDDGTVPIFPRDCSLVTIP